MHFYFFRLFFLLSAAYPLKKRGESSRTTEKEAEVRETQSHPFQPKSAVLWDLGADPPACLFTLEHALELKLHVSLPWVLVQISLGSIGNSMRKRSVLAVFKVL